MLYTDFLFNKNVKAFLFFFKKTLEKERYYEYENDKISKGTEGKRG